MLNALRHQRFGHWRDRGRGTWDSQSRAQRLTASEVWTLAINDRFDFADALFVLNALRHQRFGHLELERVLVLLQVRAQRLTASEVWTFLNRKHGGVGMFCAQRLTASEVWTSKSIALSFTRT